MTKEKLITLLPHLEFLQRRTAPIQVNRQYKMKQIRAVDECMRSPFEKIIGETLIMAIIAPMNNNIETDLYIIFCIIYSPPNIES